MMTYRTSRRAVVLGGLALLAGLYALPALSQDVNLKATYGSVELKAGFEPDPFKVKLDAGGPIQTDKGDLKAWIANAPDYRLVYEAGKFPLTFFVESDEDTTLLVNLPDGKWVANDDGPGTGLNPLIKLERPQSGRYEIWVGMLQKKNAKATLHITELK